MTVKQFPLAGFPDGYDKGVTSNSVTRGQNATGTPKNERKRSLSILFSSRILAMATRKAIPSGLEATVLDIVRQLEEPHRAELARQAGITTAAAAKLLQTLQDRRWVARSRKRVHRHLQVFRLTADGRTALRSWNRWPGRTGIG